MIKIEMTRGQNYFYSGTTYQRGKEYLVPEDVADHLLAQMGPSDVPLFKEIRDKKPAAKKPAAKRPAKKAAPKKPDDSEGVDV